ncbi:MAG: energy-coupling factor transporter transmembrane protein EcfT [Anaerolineae bacterium]|nr:energy-coupling factor transporter transmembrane protein EcfT [Anaerolineae bacterium]
MDTRAWLIWLAAMLTPALIAFNPFVQVLTIGIVIVLFPDDADERSFLRMSVLLRLAVFALVVGGGFNLISVHFGTTVITQLPESIPIIGGAWTLESLLYGICNALRLVSIVFAFALFSRVINYADLLRLAPAAVAELGLMLSIGITLVPLTLRSFQEIREAQQLRGYRGRGVRAMLPLFTPLVANGMEHALALAESMEARGYGAARSVQHVRRGQVALLIGLLGALILLGANAFFALDVPILVIGWLVVALPIGGGVYWLSIGSGRTRLRRGKWGSAETVMVLGAVIAVSALIIVSPTIRSYDPYRLATIGLPAFDPYLGIALLGLALPGIYRRQEARSLDDQD